MTRRKRGEFLFAGRRDSCGLTTRFWRYVRIWLIFTACVVRIVGPGNPRLDSDLDLLRTALLRNRRGATLFEPAKDDEIVTALVAALTRAFNDGSPVVGESLKLRREIAVTALRRIRSSRRRGVSLDDRPHCIRDLAKGLTIYLEARPNSVGTLIKDYQFVASELLDAYRTAGGS